jgi:hypothetical protein
MMVWPVLSFVTEVCFDERDGGGAQESVPVLSVIGSSFL